MKEKPPKRKKEPVHVQDKKIHKDIESLWISWTVQALYKIYVNFHQSEIGALIESFRPKLIKRNVPQHQMWWFKSIYDTRTIKELVLHFVVLRCNVTALLRWPGNPMWGKGLILFGLCLYYTIDSFFLQEKKKKKATLTDSLWCVT